MYRPAVCAAGCTWWELFHFTRWGLANRVPRVLLPAAFGGRSFVSFRTPASVHVRAAYSVVMDALFVSGRFGRVTGIRTGARILCVKSSCCVSMWNE